ncbi:MAG: tRNA pseudouridine(38-40) synthase TruA [Leptolinea sp.]
MERYQLILAYDGTLFFGYQRQGKARTVQLVLEEALRQLDWQENSTLCAGRTDSGVHATGQVVSFGLEWKHSLDDLRNAINARLPEDMSVLKVEIVSTDFHPRFDALLRKYEYQVYFSPARNPLKNRIAWRIWPKIEIERLQETSPFFLGVHDFSAFGGPMKPGASTIREVLESRWHHRDEDLVYQVTATAFLYHMIRRVVWQQVLCATGRITFRELQDGIEKAAPLPPGMAPPNGLTLVKVTY